MIYARRFGRYIGERMGISKMNTWIQIIGVSALLLILLGPVVNATGISEKNIVSGSSGPSCQRSLPVYPVISGIPAINSLYG